MRGAAGITAGPLRRVTAAGAWLFALASLAALLWIGVQRLGDPAGSDHLFRTTVGGVSHSGLGFAYQGPGGTALLIAQIALVSAAIVMASHSRTVLRRLGHAILVAWCALFVFNAISLWAIDGMPLWAAVAAISGLLLACTAHRAACQWRGPREDRGIL
jgi:hypothetical protein